jgi:hypothetical protein
MPTKLLALIAALAALLMLPMSAEAADKRVALVIGNGIYQSVARLANPVNDATAMAQMFKNAGFSSVTMRQDLGVVEFKRALRDFFDAAQDADVAVVYYAGHGVQVGDMNYMIPVDARLATEIDVQDEAVSLDRILAALQPAKRLRLVILDACRENPFLSRMKVSNATRSIGRGLGRVEPENSSLVAYAAKNGQIAQDGAGDHSPFTAALIKHLAVPGLDIRLALGRVRDDVLKSTGGKQEPFVYGSLGGDSVSLFATPAEPKREALTDVKGDYELVERIGTQKAWEAFLASHKDGLYAELARAQLAKLVPADSKPAPNPPPTMTVAATQPTTPPNPSVVPSKERIDWDLVRDSGDRAKLRDFIAKYPASPLAETAKNQLEGLERAARERDEKLRAEQQARLAKSGNEPSTPQDEAACSRDEQKLALLRGQASQGWAQEDLKRLERTTTCARVRSEVALLVGPSEAPSSVVQPTPDVGQRAAISQQQLPGNVLEPVLSAIGEWRRLGCVAGQNDPALGGAITDAIRRYLAEKGRPEEDVRVVESLITDFKAENERLCGRPCAQGEHREGERCVADAKPETRPAQHETVRPIVRPRTETQERPRQQTKAKREESRPTAVGARPERPRPERLTSQPNPQPTARSEASAVSPPRQTSTIGVGF